MKLESITYKDDGESLIGIGVAITNNCRSPFYEGRNHKKGLNRPTTGINLS